jgi:hypothetical protein
VSVYFEGGDPNKPYWTGATPTINGDKLEGANIGKAPGTETSAANWRDPAKKPNINVLAQQANGTVIVIDDNPGSTSLTLYLANGHLLTMTDSGQSGVMLKTKSGHIAHLDDTGKKITLQTASGASSMVMNDDGTIQMKGPTRTDINP